ncbi:cytochrome c oxidase assembly protein PET191-domain-containing protein [Russula dissimulans]|nr:cytochrome c oxidase assembly protein PET191-domain-containing protein [Russula dissimulans]
MPNYCEPLLAALKDCVLHSDCVIKQGNLPSECIKHHTDELPEECRSLRLATFECKRGMLDMRKRLRGNNAGATVARIKKESASVETTELPGNTDSAVQ